MEKQTNDSEKVLEEIVVTPYKYGFKTEIENENFPKGLNQEIVDQISRKKDEPLFMSQFRAQAFSQWQKCQALIGRTSESHQSIIKISNITLSQKQKRS